MLNWIVASCVLTAAMLLIRLFARGKVSARALYALWLLVALRLLIPGSVGASEASVETVVQRAPVVQLTERLSGAESIEYTPAGEIEAHYSGESAPAIIAESATEREFDLMSALLSLKKLAIPLWLTGAAGMALAFLGSALKFSRSVRRTREHLPVEGAPVPVYVSGEVDTPCLFGLISPAIYVPPEVAADETILRHAAAHEASHYRQLDHVWCVVRCACLALHWYNPLVWIAARASRRDCELACDEATVRRLGEGERADYGRSLIKLTCESPRGAAVATTMSARPGELRQRIKLLARHRQSALALMLALVLALTAAACSFTGSASQRPGSVSYESGISGTDIYGFTAPEGSDNLMLNVWYFNGSEWEVKYSSERFGDAKEGRIGIHTDTTDAVCSWSVEMEGLTRDSDEYDLRGISEGVWPRPSIRLTETREVQPNEAIPLVMVCGTKDGENYYRSGSMDFFEQPELIDDDNLELICVTVTFIRADGHIAQSEQDVGSGTTAFDYTAPDGARGIRFAVYRYDCVIGEWDLRMISDRPCKTGEGRITFTSDLPRRTFGFGVEYADGTGSSVDGLSLDELAAADAQEVTSWGYNVNLTSDIDVGLNTEVSLMLFTGMVGDTAYTGTDYFEHPEYIEGDDEYICVTVMFTSYGSIEPADDNTDGERVYDFTVPAGTSEMLVREYSLEGRAWNEIRRETFDCTENSGQLAFRLDMENAALGYDVRFDPDEQFDLTSHSLGEYVSMPAGGWLTEPYSLYVEEEVPLVMLQSPASSFYSTPDMFTSPDELPDSGIVCVTVAFFNGGLPDAPQPVTPPSAQSAELEGFSAAYDPGSSYEDIASAWVHAYAENLVIGLPESDPASCSSVSIEACEALYSSLTRPERIIARMRLACQPRDREGYERFYGNTGYLLHPLYDSAALLLDRYVILEPDGSRAVCVGADTDLPELWGYQSLASGQDPDAFAQAFAELEASGGDVSTLLPTVNYSEMSLSGESRHALCRALSAAAIAPEGADDQLVRDMYAMLAVNGADGAYSAWLGNIYREQREHDPETFNLALSAFNAETQEHITYLADNPV